MSAEQRKKLDAQLAGDTGLADRVRRVRNIPGGEVRGRKRGHRR